MAWRRLATAGNDGVAKVWIFTEDEIMLPSVLDGGSAQYGVRDEKHGTVSQESDTWRGHTAPITSLAWCPGEEQILTTSKDGKAKVWCCTTQISCLPVGAASAEEKEKGKDMSRTGSQSSRNGKTPTINFWMRRQTLPPPAKPEEKAAVEGPQKKPFLRMIEAKYLALSHKSSAPTVNIVDKGHRGGVCFGMFGTMTLNNDLKPRHWAATCSDDKSAIVWNLKDGKRVFTLESVENGHTGSVTGVTTNRGDFGPQLLLTRSADRTCKLWDLKTGAYVKTISDQGKGGPADPYKGAHDGAIWSAYFSNEVIQGQILTASQDGFVKVWDVSTAKCVRAFPGKPSQVLHAKWHPDRTEMFIAWRLDGQIIGYDYRTPPEREVFRLRHHDKCVWTVEYSNCGANQLLTSSHDNTAAIVDVRGGTCAVTGPQSSQSPGHGAGTGSGVVSTLTGHTGLLWQAKWSPDDAYVVTASEDRSAQIFQVAGGGSRISGRVLCETKPEPGSRIPPPRGVLYDITHRLGVTHVAWDAWDGNSMSGRSLKDRSREEVECFDTRGA